MVITTTGIKESSDDRLVCSLVPRLQSSHFRKNGSGQLPISFFIQVMLEVIANNLIAMCMLNR